MEARVRYTTTVSTNAPVQAASMASGKSVGKSRQTISTSWRPRLANSAQTDAQNFAPSVACTQMSRTLSADVICVFRACSEY